MRADRLVAIVLALQARGRMCAAELAERLEISERTVRRDLEALSLAGIPVHALRGRGGGWELVEGYRTDLTGLSIGEAEALFAAAGPQAVAAGLGLEPPVRTALLKLLAALPAAARRQAEAARERILVDLLRWGEEEVEAHPPHLAALRRATLDGRQVELTYAKPGQAPERRRVQPYGLVAKAGTWYLMAGTPSGVRTFRVSRVQAVEVTGEAVERPERFDLEAAWARVRAEAPRRFDAVAVELLVDPEIEAPLRRAFAGWSQVRSAVAAPGDPRRRLTVRAAGVTGAARELLRFTGHIEVLGPPAMRAELARLGQELVRHYRGPAPGGVH
jgi:predicted DNA-binding transcriptional regulator YafY